MTRAARAVVFDLDGTLVDSEPLHERAARDTLLGFGIDPPPGAFDEFIGQRVDELTTQLAARYGVPADALLTGRERRFTALLDTLDLMPGAAACLDRLRGHRTRVALATSATRSYLDHVLGRFGWRDVFAAVVCGDEVTAGKPDPETYLRVADRLGRPATGCLVVEDSPRGCAAGVAAGMDVVVVDHARRPHEVYRGARWIVPDLDSAGDLLCAETADAPDTGP
jgi:HAD superfamily hydrolase (TIGR01509 family)